MQSLAARAATIDIAVFDSSTSCGGNDVAADAPAPLVSRHIDGHGDTTLQLPAGHYVVVLHAFDAAGAFIGSACQAELFTPGQRACVSVTLSTPMIDGDGGIPDLAIGGGGGGGSGGGGSGGSDMGSKTFVAQTSGVTSTLYQIWSAGGGVVYVVGVGGVLLKTTDGGAVWTKLNSGTTFDLEAAWGSSATDVYVVGKHGVVLHTTNGGTNWSTVNVGITTDLYDVWGAGASDVYITGDRGVVLHGSGSSFTAVSTSSGMTPINCVWGSGGSDVFLFGGNGLILHGSAATSFNKGFSPTGDYLNYGWGDANSDDVWIPSMNSTGTSSSLWHSSDRGASWQSQMTTASPLWAVWSTPGGDTFVVGDQIQESTDRGAHWTGAGSTPGLLYGVGGDVNGTAVWAVGVNGTIVHRP
ncbi:MAG: glucosyltransferase-I precursor [bacterium]|nr:glucosyltransferase-I precursor [bacterium]